MPLLSHVMPTLLQPVRTFQIENKMKWNRMEMKKITTLAALKPVHWPLVFLSAEFRAKLYSFGFPILLVSYCTKSGTKSSCYWST